MERFEKSRMAIYVLPLWCSLLGCGGPGHDAPMSDASPDARQGAPDAGGSPDGSAPTRTEQGDGGHAIPDAGDDGATPTHDPAPGIAAPGEHGCEACPDTEEDTFMLELAGVTARTFTGTVTGAEGDGIFFVAGPDGQELFGPIETNPDTGAYSVTIPLFCGEQLVKRVWSNSAGSYVLVVQVTTTDCVAADMRLTLSWDALGRDWELHLIKPGGRINDRTGGTDCTWTTCLGSSPDWGVQGDDSDDPEKDVDDIGPFGPENIFLAKPETGVYTVMVEHWGNGDPESDGNVIINVRNRPPVVVRMEDLPPQHVWTAARIDWPSGVVTPSQEVFDCSDSWSRGCTADIP